MRTVCVDDDRETLRQTVSLCGEMLQITELTGFSDPEEALEYIQGHPPELALLDIRMPGMDGLALAGAIRALSPDTAILFLTAHPQYAVEAWKLHAAGYILKPLTRERLSDELNNAAEWRLDRAGECQIPHIQARTFGNFDLIVNGERASFARSKAKELLACLVDRKGIRMTREEIFHLLWGEEEYTRPRQKVLDVVIRSLRDTLRSYGISEILKLEHGTLRIDPKALDCDMYRLFAGDERYENTYQGEYMGSYSWANQTEGAIDSELTRRWSLRSRRQNPSRPEGR